LTYIPFTSGSVELDWSVKNWSVYSLFMFQGYRYALQENIPSNIVDGYYTIDVGGSMKFDFKNQQLKLNVSLKNITNRYNQYIRYFVLPGFNYQLKLTYAI
jgi:outer membrane receptor protein involved in Fe transport